MGNNQNTDRPTNAETKPVSDSSEALQRERDQLSRNRQQQKNPLSTTTENAARFLPVVEIEGFDVPVQPVKDNSADNKPEQKDETVVDMGNGRRQYYDKDGTLIAVAVNDKRWDLKYEGDILVRYEGKNSSLQYQKNGWNRCVGEVCNRIDGFKLDVGDGKFETVTGAVTKESLANPGAVKFADIPEISETSRRMFEMLRNGGGEAAVKYLSSMFGTLDSEQLAQLQKQYQTLTGKSMTSELQTLKDAGLLTEATANVLGVLLTTGSDKRTAQQSADLAMTTLSEPNSRIGLSLLSATFGGNSENAQAARQLFAQMGGEDKIRAAYSDESTANKALDIVREGGINPATLMKENFGAYSNMFGLDENNLDEIIQSMTAPQRADYLAGERLNKQYGPYSAEQERQIKFYNTVHEAMRESSQRIGFFRHDNDQQRKVLHWEDMIRNDGQKGLISYITDNPDDAEGIKSILNKMTKADYARIASDPQYKETVVAAIESSFSNKGPRTGPMANLDPCLSVLNHFDEMLSKGSLENATKVTSQKFNSDMYTPDLRPGYATPQRVVQDLENIDSKFQDSIKQNQQTRENVVNTINKLTPEGSYERALSLDSVNAITEDRVSSQSTLLKRSVIKSLMSGESPLEVAALVRNSLKNSPEIIKQFAEHPEMRKEIANYLTTALKGKGDVAEKLLNGSGLSIEEIRSFTTERKSVVTTGPNGKDRVEEISVLSKNDAIKGLSLLENPDAAPVSELGSLSAEEKKVADIVKTQGQIQPEDQVRLFVIGVESSPDTVKNMFERMTDVEKKKYIDAYQAKYGGDLVKDAVSKVYEPIAKTEMQRTVSMSAVTSVGNLSRGLNDKAEAENGVTNFGRAFSETIAGNFYAVQDANAANSALTVKDLMGRRENLTPDEKARLDEALKNIMDASKDIRAGKEAAVAKMEKAMMVAAIILSLPATAGMNGLALLAASATLTAVAQAVMRSKMKGSDYSNTDLMKDAAFIGTAILLDGAPIIASSLVRSVNSSTVKLLRTDVALKDMEADLAKTIKLSAYDKTAAEEALTNIAKKYAKEGNEGELLNQLNKGLKDASNSSKQPVRKAVSSSSTEDAVVVNTSSRNVVQDPNFEAKFGAGSRVNIQGDERMGTILRFDRQTGKAYVEMEGGKIELIERQKLLPERAAQSVVDGAEKTTSTVMKPLSGEDNYRLNMYLKKTNEQGFSSLNVAESNEFSALLKRVKPGDAIYPEAMKDIALEPTQSLLKRSIINYESNMVKPGDMSLFAGDFKAVDHRFLELKPGAELLPWADGASMQYANVSCRTYTMKNGTEIIVPETLAKKLDEVRILKEKVAYVGWDPRKILQRNSARFELANNPLRNHPLPEEVAKMVSELPSQRRVDQLVLSDQPYPQDLWRRSQNQGSTTSGVSFNSNGEVQLFPSALQNGMRNEEDATHIVIYETNNHEYTHKLQEGSNFEAFRIASERDNYHWIARPYATTNTNEDWAVHFGEVMLDSKADKLVEMAESAPLRALAIANSLKAELKSADASSAYTAQLLDRIKLVEKTSMPNAQKVIQFMTRSGDPKEVETALKYVAALTKGDPTKAALLTDAEGLMKVVQTSEDMSIVAMALPYTKAWLKNRPGAYEQLVSEVVERGTMRIQTLLRSGDNEKISEAISSIKELQQALPSQAPQMFSTADLISAARAANEQQVLRDLDTYIKAGFKNDSAGYERFLDEMVSRKYLEYEASQFYITQPSVASRIKALDITNKLKVDPRYHAMCFEQSVSGMTPAETEVILLDVLKKYPKEDAPKYLAALANDYDETIRNLAKKHLADLK